MWKGSENYLLLNLLLVHDNNSVLSSSRNAYNLKRGVSDIKRTYDDIKINSVSESSTKKKHLVGQNAIWGIQALTKYYLDLKIASVFS